MEGVDPIGIVDETQCVQDIMDDIVSEEKQNAGTSSNFIDKRLDDLDENDMKELIFKTPVECEVFYFSYAKAVGFGVSREAPRINRHGIVTSLRFCCDREGVRSEKDKNREDKKKKARDETRCFCKAFISMKYMKTTCQYMVKEFKREHNHHLVPPQQVNLIRAFRGIDDVTKIQVSEMYDLGISQKQIYTKIVHDAGGHDNFGCVRKDVYNVVDQHRRRLENDAESVLAYLHGKQEIDPLFFVSYTVDVDGKLDKLFWCDGRSRMDYEIFGHTLAFDTTYKSNKYNKPFIVFVGINHHLQTIPFGCALLLDEMKETYIWVLHQLVKAMDGRKPTTIMTNRDNAMAYAIREVLPGTCHRICLWHLMKNVVTHAGKRFAHGFIKCVDKYRKPEDFEKGWQELLHHYKIDMKKHKWAADMYETKEKWAEAFLQGYFFGGMRSTQRCESMNRTVKAFVNKNMKLYQFVQSYERGVSEIRYQEMQNDYTSKYSIPEIHPPLLNIKRDAAQVYTRRAYNKFQQELMFESAYVVKEQQETNGCKFYRLEESDKKCSSYIVVYVSSNDTMSCCCMKLESVGFPCRHTIAVMKHEQFDRIPRGCILKRWTIYARPDLSVNETAVFDQHVTNSRYAYLMSLFTPLCRMASKEEVYYKETMDCVQKLWLKYKHAEIEGKTIEKDSPLKLNGIRDPDVVSTKGRGKKQRLRKCGHCGIRGHNKRKCPQLEVGKDVRINACEFQSSQFPRTLVSSHEVSFNLNETPLKDEDNSINLNSCPPSPEEASTSRMEPPSSNGLLHCMPSLYEEGEASMATYHPHVDADNLDDDTLVVDWVPDLHW